MKVTLRWNQQRSSGQWSWECGEPAGRVAQLGERRSGIGRSRVQFPMSPRPRTRLPCCKGVGMPRKMRGPVKIQSHLEQNLTLLLYRSMQIHVPLAMIYRFPCKRMCLHGRQRKHFSENFNRKVGGPWPVRPPLFLHLCGLLANRAWSGLPRDNGSLPSRRSTSVNGNLTNPVWRVMK